MQKSKAQTNSCCGPDCCTSGEEIVLINPDIKDQIRKQYGSIALGESQACCGPECCAPGGAESATGTTSRSPKQATQMIGYSSDDLQSIPEASILGVGCGAPLHFAKPRVGETVVDLGSGAGIDVFLSANKVGERGRVIGIDMTDEMLERARHNAKAHGYDNVEFRKGDIEKHIPVENGSADLVISNCVINLTTDKTDTFKEVHRILKKGGRMVISDLVTDKEVPPESADPAKWCGCIDGALTREHYMDSIRKAGFESVEVLQERLYTEGDGIDGRKITSLVLSAVK